MSPSGGAHAKQQLVAHDRASGKLDDRLAVEHDAVLVEGGADLLGPGAAPIRAAGQAPRVERHAVPAGSLRLIHRAVGAPQSLLGAQEVSAQAGEADADRRAHRLAREDLLAAPETLEQVLGDGRGIVHARAAQQNRELVAAQPPHRVGLAQAVAQQLRGLAHESVAGLMAEGVVHLLQVVQVQHQQRARVPVAAHQLDLQRQRLQEAPAVEQAGQRVVFGQELELALERLALGDVGQHALVVGPLARGRAQDALVAHPQHPAVLGDHPVLGGQRDALHGLALLLEHPVAVLRVDPPRPQRGVGDPLLRGEAQHLLELRRDVAPGALRPGLGDVADRRKLLDQRAVPALGLAQALLSRDHVADVGRDHHDAGHLPGRVSKRRGVHHQMNLAAVLSQRDELAAKSGAPALDPLEHRLFAR
jgi:hypothetical protein